MIQKEDYDSKASRLDIEAVTDTGTIVNVEMQCVDTGDLDSRSITYAAQLISQHTKKGFSYNVIWIDSKR